jgi:hypothetical protein
LTFVNKSGIYKLVQNSDQIQKKGGEKQMKVSGGERSTGRGAVQYTAVLTRDGWVRLSCFEDAVYTGKGGGAQREYELEVDEDCIFAHFYRSNKGNESVYAYFRGKKKEFASFDAADDFAQKGNLPDGAQLYNGRYKETY